MRKLSDEQKRHKEIFEQVLKFSQADETEATIESRDDSLTRFANNIIHQNVTEEGTTLTVRAVADRRTAAATTNRLDTDSIRRTVEAAVELARLQPPDPDWLSMAGPETVRPVDRFFPRTAECSPQSRAETVRACIAQAEREKLTTAGIFSTGSATHSIFNSRGVECSHQETASTFSVTVEGESSSGWAKYSAPDADSYDPEKLTMSAARKTEQSRKPKEIAPGSYTVILEPSAVLDVLGFLMWDFGGLSVAEKRSCLTGRVGEKVFGENITLTDDVFHSLQTGAPFDGEGVPRKPITLVERGVVKNLVYARKTAHKMSKKGNVRPTGHGFSLPNEEGEAPMNIVFAGGESNLDQMVRSTERGILVTRLWYIREVDPYRKILTGMTRDGTFWVEKGEVQYGIRNLRFNQSLIEMLNRVEMLGPAACASGEESFEMVVPALKVRDFTFSSVTKF